MSSASRTICRLLLATGIACGASSACSSSSGGSGLTCGPGTTPQGGCVIADASADVMGSSDSAMGSEPYDASESASMVEAGTSTDSGTASDGGDAGMPADDPCPGSTTTYTDCSTTCGTQDSCSALACGGNGIEINTWSDLPYTIRTPSAPGVDPSCPTDCGVTEDYALILISNLPDKTADVKITVGAPWQVAVWSGITGGPECPGGNAQCLVVPSQGAVFGVYTNDPNAPARNVVITKTTTMCP